MKRKSIPMVTFIACASLFFLTLITCSAQAKTRWSALHFVPDADLLQSGQFVFDGQGYYFSDTSGKAVVNPVFFVSLGIIEWVNLEAGYAGGPTIGFKARILGETKPWMPSLAIGAHNILTNKESGLFSVEKDSGVANEFYLALGKSIEPLKMRIHLGLQTIPQSKTEQVNPYFGIEQYFGMGLYGSLEVFRRKQEFHPSLFVSWRLFKKQLEISAGAVRINRMFFDQNNQFKVSFGGKGTDEFVKPGIWFGLRYSFVLNFAKTDAFRTIDDKVGNQNDKIKLLSLEMDSLKKLLGVNQRRMADVNHRLMLITDSMSSDKSRLKPMMLEKIVTLKTLYADEPFEPEKVKRLINEIVSMREDALPPLREILLDKKIDKRIRVISISLLGNIANSGASDILLDMLSQTQDSEIKIEILIALGKMRETRAEYVLEQLANDPVDEVAFTAQEVLHKLAKQTGMKISPDLKMRKVEVPDTNVITDVKIKTKTQKEAVADQKASPPPAQQPLSKAAEPVKAPDSLVKKPPEPAAKTVPMADTAKTVPQAPKKPAVSEDLWGVGDSAKAIEAKSSVKTDTGTAAITAKSDTSSPATAKEAPSTKKASATDKKTKEKKSARPKSKPEPSQPEDNKNW
jgi:hypothetical protein